MRQLLPRRAPRPSLHRGGALACPHHTYFEMVRPKMTESSEAADITIVLADDHAVVRSGLRLLLDQAGGLHGVSEAGDAESALRPVLGHKPSVLVLDLNMPGELPSLDAIPKVAEASPGTRVVVLTMQEDPEFARQALRAGAAGYVLKEAADSELVDAVRRAAAGETYLNPRLGAALGDAPPARARRTAPPASGPPSPPRRPRRAAAPATCPSARSKCSG